MRIIVQLPPHHTVFSTQSKILQMTNIWLSSELHGKQLSFSYFFFLSFSLSPPLSLSPFLSLFLVYWDALEYAFLPCIFCSQWKPVLVPIIFVHNFITNIHNHKTKDNFICTTTPATEALGTENNEYDLFTLETKRMQ